MSTFGLKPQDVLPRIRAAETPPPVPSRARSVLLGAAGFGLASVLAFGLWAAAGRDLQAQLGEAGFYLVCAGVFINVAVWILHRLVIGVDVFARFYLVFNAAFGLYAVGWTAAWIALGGTSGEWAGALLGSLLLGATLGQAFDSPPATRLQIVLALFLTHCAGYFSGAAIYDLLQSPAGADLLPNVLSSAARSTLAKLQWGALFGLALGAGLGYALHAAQEPIRQRLRTPNE